jgi:putative ABC transport system substrate-binding protein
LHYPSSSESSIQQQEAFRRGLREYGYVEGQNLLIETRWSDGRPERLPELAAELVQIPVDVIATHGEASLAAAQQATTTIPIVVAIIGDLVTTGYAASYGRPGGNVTGMTDLAPTLSGKRMEPLKAVVPGMANLGVLWNTTNRVKTLEFGQMQGAAKTLGVAVQSFDVRGPGDFEAAFEQARRARIDALTVLNEPLTNSHRPLLTGFAARQQLPAIYFDRQWVVDGGLMSYGVNLIAQWQRAAGYVDKLLRGAKAAELPVEQPTTFEMVVNLPAAQALGLTLPPQVLAQATEVIP